MRVCVCMCVCGMTCGRVCDSLVNVSSTQADVVSPLSFHLVIFVTFSLSWLTINASATSAARADSRLSARPGYRLTPDVMSVTAPNVTPTHDQTDHVCVSVCVYVYVYVSLCVYVYVSVRVSHAVFIPYQ